MLVQDEKTGLLKSVPIKLDAKGADNFMEQIKESIKAPRDFEKLFGKKKEND
ncbi:MAG: hypothetical protein LBN08_07175 [Lactobacillales bacterium]|jgi:hypothetical protein|nr:hypothetical protein [Lactobacillales bacterium]